MIDMSDKMTEATQASVISEITELQQKHWEGVIDAAKETGTGVAKMIFNVQIDMTKPIVETKTTLAYTIKTSETITEEIEDQRQLKMENVVEEAQKQPRKRGRPKKNP